MQETSYHLDGLASRLFALFVCVGLFACCFRSHLPVSYIITMVQMIVLDDGRRSPSDLGRFFVMLLVTSLFTICIQFYVCVLYQPSLY